MPIDVAEQFVLHRARVYRWAFAMCGRHADALDAVQEVFLRMLRNPPDTPNEKSALAWLRRVTSRVVIDRWRGESSRAALRESFTPHENADDALETREQEQRLRLAIRGLSQQQRLVLTAKMYDRLTFQEIAEQHGMAVSTAKTHYLRALNMVRTRLNIEFPVRRES